MEEKLNQWDKFIDIFFKAFQTIFNISKTKLGSGLIGFLTAVGICWVLWISSLKNEIATKTLDILSLKSENIDLKNSLKICQEESANAYERARIQLKKESRDEMNYAIESLQKLQKEFSNENSNKAKRIQALEAKYQKRKEELE